LTIDGRRCDANGDVYLVAADNQTLAATPQPDNPGIPAHYGFEVTPSKARLNMLVSLSPGSANITDQTNKTYVGERLALSCVLSPQIATITNYQWSIPGTYVSNYVVTQTNATVYPLTSAGLTNSGLTFSWTDGSGGSLLEVRCTVVVQGVTMSATSKFEVVKPTASLLSYPLGVVGVAGSRLGYGLVTTTNPGILFVGTNFAPAEVATNNGSWFFGQTLSTDFKFNHVDFYSASFTTNGADQFPYVPLPGDTNSNPFGIVVRDSPDVVLDPTTVKLWRNDSFVMYLLFQSQRMPSIPVPIKQTSWFWGGTCTNVGGNWGPGSLLSSPTNCGIISSDVNSTGLPEWKCDGRTVIWTTNALWFP
jgi:hypothetical protein